VSQLRLRVVQRHTGSPLKLFTCRRYDDRAAYARKQDVTRQVEMPALTRSSLSGYRLVGYQAEWQVSIDSTDRSSTRSVSRTRDLRTRERARARERVNIIYLGTLRTFPRRNSFTRFASARTQFNGAAGTTDSRTRMIQTVACNACNRKRIKDFHAGCKPIRLSQRRRAVKDCKRQLTRGV